MKTASEVKVEKGYFRSSPRYGRTSLLVDVKTGIVILEVMGVVGKRDMLAQYNRSHAAK